MYISSVQSRLSWRKRRSELKKSLTRSLTARAGGQSSMYQTMSYDPTFVELVLDVVTQLVEPAGDEPDHRELWHRDTQLKFEALDFKEIEPVTAGLFPEEVDQAEFVADSLEPTTWSKEEVLAMHEFMLTQALKVVRNPKAGTEALKEIKEWMTRDEPATLPFSFDACCSAIPCDPYLLLGTTLPLLDESIKKAASIEEKAKSSASAEDHLEDAVREAVPMKDKPRQRESARAKPDAMRAMVLRAA